MVEVPHQASEGLHGLPRGCHQFLPDATELPGLSTGHTQTRSCWGSGQRPLGLLTPPLRGGSTADSLLAASGWVCTQHAQTTAPRRLLARTPPHTCQYADPGSASGLLSFTPRLNLKTRHVIMTTAVLAAQPPVKVTAAHN